MEIDKLIRHDLWQTIKNTYSSGNYTHAIVDGVNFLRNLLQEKSGLELDGVSLVNMALSEKNPIIKLNKLETETEKNIQEGTRFLLVGLYKAIRNPRSHEQHENIDDTKETADELLMFINYLSNTIDKSKSSFSLDEFLLRIFDKHFVNEKKYVKLLIDEIPKKKRFDTLVAIYRRKEEGDIYTIGLVVEEIINILSDAERQNFFSIISEELKTENDETKIIYNLKIIPVGSWEKISKISRMRLENIVLHSFEEGGKDSYDEKGVLATWAKQHFECFDEKEKINKIIMDKMTSKYIGYLSYLWDYFYETIFTFITSSSDISFCVKAISSKIIEGSTRLQNFLTDNYYRFPNNWKQLYRTELDGIIDFSNNEEIPF